MKDLRHGICPLCDHREVLEAAATEFTAPGVRTRAAVRFVRDPVDGSPTVALGPLTVYVCRGCGYTQWFAATPEEIPVSEAAHTRLIKGPPAGSPYR